MLDITQMFWMESKIYFAIVLALYVIKRCHSQELKIKKIQRYGVADEHKLNLCFENVRDVDPSYYQLVIIDTHHDPVVERPVINEDDGSVDGCVTFGDSELQDYAGKPDIYFILTGRDADDKELVFGTAQLNMPHFPESVEADGVTAYFVGTKDDKSLRVNDHIKPAAPETWTITNDGGNTKLECLYPTDGSKETAQVPCFVIQKGGLQDDWISALLMCLEVVNQLATEENIAVCAKDFTPKGLPDEGPSLSQAALNYSVPLPELDLKALSLNKANTMDVVLYSASGSNLKIYVKKALSSSMNLKTYTPDFKDYKVLLVGLDATNVKESTLAYFQDYKVRAQGLATGSRIMEVQWKKTDVEKYSLTRSTLASGDGGSFEQTTVNCPGAKETFCYGYFVELEDGDYDVTFKPYKDDSEDPNNVIISKSKEIISRFKTKENKILINTVNITWNLEDEAVVILCYHHSEDSNLSEYIYEAIIINNEGQWRRDEMFLPAEKGVFCSMEITLPSQQFKRHSVLTGAVVKRHPNGFDIIDSGYITFQLS